MRVCVSVVAADRDATIRRSESASRCIILAAMDVLLVDDNELNVRALSRVLRSRHTVRIALSSSQALAEVEARRPDVIICDFELGDETCTALLRAVSALHPGTRRILYSASRPELWEELVRDKLVDVTLAKPITVDALLASLGDAPVG